MLVWGHNLCGLLPFILRRVLEVLGLENGFKPYLFDQPPILKNFCIFVIIIRVLFSLEKVAPNYILLLSFFMGILVFACTEVLIGVLITGAFRNSAFWFRSLLWLSVFSFHLLSYFFSVKDLHFADSAWHKQVAVAVDFKDQAAEQQTMQQNLQNICLKTGAPMESHAASVLTPFAFSKLQEQLVLAAHYASFPFEDGFLVRHHTKLEGGRKVYWAPQEGIISCSCHQFEFSGILCRHTLRVLSTGNCFQIPERYLPLRWRKISTHSVKLLQSSPSDHAERIQFLQSMVSSLIAESVKSKERLDLATEQVSYLLSRIRQQPVTTQGLRDISPLHRNL